MLSCISVLCSDTLSLCCGTQWVLKFIQMSPSVGGNVPQHLLPYESELGLNVTQESLILHVFHMDKRPSIPQHWGLLPQVFLHRCFSLKYIYIYFFFAMKINVLDSS